MCQRNFQCAFLAAVAGVTLMSGAAGAQQATGTDTKRDMNDLYNHSTSATSQAKSNAAINTDRKESRTAAAPVAGRNSFTESEARRRIESFGYTGVSDLIKDAQGVWRGSAARHGQTTNIALDYQGNIVGNQP